MPSLHQFLHISFKEQTANDLPSLAAISTKNNTNSLNTIALQTIKWHTSRESLNVFACYNIFEDQKPDVSVLSRASRITLRADKEIFQERKTSSKISQTKRQALRVNCDNVYFIVFTAQTTLYFTFSLEVGEGFTSPHYDKNKITASFHS